MAAGALENGQHTPFRIGVALDFQCLPGMSEGGCGNSPRSGGTVGSSVGNAAMRAGRFGKQVIAAHLAVTLLGFAGSAYLEKYFQPACRGW